LTAPPPPAQPYLARRQNWSTHSTTWGDLDRRVTSLAGALSRRGVGFGDRVLILMLNRTEFIESFLAANRLGAIAVPVNFRMTAPEIAFLVGDCQAEVVLTDGHRHGREHRLRRFSRHRLRGRARRSRSPGSGGRHPE